MLRTTDIPLVTPCLTIIAGTGGNLSEGEKGEDVASRATYESPAEEGGSFMVEVRERRGRSLVPNRRQEKTKKPLELHRYENRTSPDVMATTSH